MNNNNEYKVELKIKTLKTGPCLAINLFNYSAKEEDIYTEQKTITNECYILRARPDFNYSILTIEDQTKYNSNNFEILFRIRQSFIDNKFEIIKPIRKKINLNAYAWYVFKSIDNFYNINNEDYILNENDIIRFGNKKYEIKKIHNSNGQIEQDKYNISAINKEIGSIFDINLKSDQYLNKIEDFLKENNKNDKKIIDNNNISCIICKQDDCSEKNPLLQLCKCENYKHYECLKNSLKIEDKNEKLIKKNIYCIECSSAYPIEFKIANNFYSLINFNPSSEIKYIILEPLNDIMDKNNINPIYIVKLVNKETKIGRENTNDFIINDRSVSKEHAVIKYDKNGNLIIQNKSTTFNTSVLIKGNIKLSEKKIHFQVGYSYIIANQINESKIKSTK